MAAKFRSVTTLNAARSVIANTGSLHPARPSLSPPHFTGTGLTYSRIASIRWSNNYPNYTRRLFSSTCLRNTTPRGNREFGSSFNTSYDPAIDSRRGPIFENENPGVPAFYPRDLKIKVDDYVVGQERAKKTICSTIFNHYQGVRRRNDIELEARAVRDRIYRQRMARDRELRDARSPDPTINGSHVLDRNHAGDSTHALDRREDMPSGRYGPDDSLPLDTASGHQPPAPPAADNYHAAYAGMTLQAALEEPLERKEDVGLPEHVNIDKSNLLLIGPTGVGKTYILETLSKKLNVPFSITDCNTLTQAGYIGQDVEACIERLLIEANYDITAAENGIIVLDEFDKIARRETTNGRDVGGEGVQQALLKLVEGSKVTVNVKDNRSSRPVVPVPTTYGTAPPPPTPPVGGQPPSGKVEQYTIDTRNILFVFCGAFVGLEKLILRRVSRPALGFGAESSAKPVAKGSGSAVLPQEMYAHLPHQPIPIGPEGTPSFKFSPLDLTTPEDLQHFGFIPELIGRVHNVCALTALSVDDLYRVLTEPKNCLVSQYTALFETYPSRLSFTRKALYAISERAAKAGTGARGLKMEMERVLAEPMFDAPMPYVLIDEACVKGTARPGYWGKDGRLEVERRIREEDMEADLEHEVGERRAAAGNAGA